MLVAVSEGWKTSQPCKVQSQNLTGVCVCVIKMNAKFEDECNQSKGRNLVGR